METITITLDGVEVSGSSGMTILELARESGVNIPTLCHDQYLTPTGACRLCIVEDEGSGALLASCVSPIRAGMIINTKSPRVMERNAVTYCERRRMEEATRAVEILDRLKTLGRKPVR